MAPPEPVGAPRGVLTGLAEGFGKRAATSKNVDVQETVTTACTGRRLREILWIHIHDESPRGIGRGMIVRSPMLERLEDRMIESAWVEFSPRERAVLLEALSAVRDSGRIKSAEVDALTIKLAHSRRHPKITIGVRSGQVRWTAGNPFPVWICDYDGEEDDLSDVDERGRRCRIWPEPANAGCDLSEVSIRCGGVHLRGVGITIDCVILRISAIRGAKFALDNAHGLRYVHALF
jgi:hypothetical protein